MASTILSEPHPPSMHGVVVQIWTKWSPTGSLSESWAKESVLGREGRRERGIAANRLNLIGERRRVSKQLLAYLLLKPQRTHMV